MLIFEEIHLPKKLIALTFDANFPLIVMLNYRTEPFLSTKHAQNQYLLYYGAFRYIDFHLDFMDMTQRYLNSNAKKTSWPICSTTWITVTKGFQKATYKFGWHQIYILWLLCLVELTIRFQWEPRWFGNVIYIHTGDVKQ